MDKEKYIPKFESRFMIPFYLKADLCDDRIFKNDWTAVDISKKYIANYVYELFNGSNKVCALYDFREERCKSRNVPMPDETVHLSSGIINPTAPQKFTFRFNQLSVFYCQETSAGIIIIDVYHDDNESIESITDKSFALAHMITNNSGQLQNHNKLELTFERDGERRHLDMLSFLSSLFPSDQGYDYEIFKNVANVKCNVFHRLTLDHKYDAKYSKNIMLLSRALHSSSDFSHYEELLNNDIYYSSGGNFFWMIDNVGAVSVSYKETDDEPDSIFQTRIHPKNVNNNYLLVYLLALHEKISLLNYNYLAVHHWDEPKKLKSLKDNLLSFNIKFSYNVISDETNYQVFYEKLSSVMKISLLENDIQEVLDKVNEEQSARSERRLNALLLALGLLAIFSALIDSFSFANEIYYSPFRPLHWLFIVIIAAFIVIGLLLYFKRRK